MPPGVRLQPESSAHQHQQSPHPFIIFRFQPVICSPAHPLRFPLFAVQQARFPLSRSRSLSI